MLLSTKGLWIVRGCTSGKIRHCNGCWGEALDMAANLSVRTDEAWSAWDPKDLNRVCFGLADKSVIGEV